MIDLSGKGAVVTGGASGIGAATAALLARLGASVLIADIDVEGAEARAGEIEAAGGRAVALRTDVRDEDDVRAAMAAAADEFGSLDIVHNNAADIALVGEDGPVAELDLGVWEASLRADLTGAMLGCKHAIPHMLRAGGGSIINTASISGIGAEVYMAAYPVAKAGVIHLTRSVALQYGKQGIRCNSICPGLILSPAGLGMPEELRELYRRHNSVDFIGEPQDIAAVVAFLACDQARLITGENITADGGITQTIPIAADARDFLAAS